jgi:hypothetical protein
MEKDLGICVELGDDAKYAVKVEGTILFQVESGTSLRLGCALCTVDLKDCSRYQI